MCGTFEGFLTPEWAGRDSEKICSPALSIYGVSTPTEFYEALQSCDLSNGFLNRFLILFWSGRLQTLPVTARQASSGAAMRHHVAAPSMRGF